MFKKIKFNDKVTLMKLLNNEFVETLGYGTDRLGNKVTVYKDLLNNHYYSYIPSFTDFYVTLQLYLYENPGLYELLQIRGMALALQIFKGNEKINVDEFLIVLDKKIKEHQLFDNDTMPLYMMSLRNILSKDEGEI